MASSTFLLYGANGYTGRLITDLAAAYNLKPILAGRNEKAIRLLADKYSMPYRVFDLKDSHVLKENLQQAPLVLNAAGPYKHTALPLIEACIATKTHYTDITGEIEVFEMLHQYHNKAMEAGIVILPGTGFDVVPTDCMALWLKQQLPTSDHLKLAFVSSGSGISKGTANTMIEGLGEGGAVREKGIIKRKALGHKSLEIEIENKKFFTMTIPWGDVSTAFYTTGIPNIETYTAVPKKIHTILQAQGLFNWLLKKNFIKEMLRKKVSRMPDGPGLLKRKSASSYIWGSVSDRAGKNVTGKMRTPDGYTLTAHSSLLIVKKVLANNYKPGFQTPAALYGSDLVLEIPGTERLK